jgi:fibronectin type 3 domain-containing protein
VGEAVLEKRELTFRALWRSGTGRDDHGVTRSFVAAAVAALSLVVPTLAHAAVSPTGLTGMPLDGSVELAWQSAAGATAYNVYRGTTSTTVTTRVSPVGGVAATGYSDSGLVNGTTYYYAVKPIVAGAESGSSSIIATTPQAPTCTVGNAVVRENCFPGSAAWKIAGSPPDASAQGIEGFATATSINKTGSIGLKVLGATTTTFNVDVYRSGFYGGTGGRLYSSVTGIAGTSQPNCTTDATTGLYDCANWSTSVTLTTTASWPSGVYIARLTRNDNGAGTHIVFVVRDDARASALVYGVDFTTYQSYNNYGGKSLYSYNSAGANTVAGTPRAVKVSFDRPYTQPRDSTDPNWYPRSDYPMVSWLESQGDDVSYISNVDLETRPVGTHQAYMSASHDEYWSAGMRTAVEQARDAGTDIFFSGSNAVFWKIRFENGAGGTNHIQVCYKSSETGGPDPSGIPTTLWRDAAVNKPENALVGQMYIGDKDGIFFPLKVSAAEGADRIWRFTGLESLAPGTTASIGTGLVGWEWDLRNTTNGFEPAGVKTLATSTATGNIFGTNYAYTPGTTPTTTTKYTAPSGALVFATGTNHWARGLGLNMDGAGEPDRRIQQATTNVLEDMGIVPATPSANITLDSATAPRVASTVPSDAATGIDLNSTVKATFSRAMNASTITTASFTLKKADGTSVAGTVSYDSATATATLTPSALLAYSTNYTARLDTTVKAGDGTPLQTAAAWTFTTRPPQSTVRLNVGGAAYTTADGRAFAADQYFTGGGAFATTSTIGGTPDQKLYQDERWGQFSYAIPVVNGAYDVTFHLVELYYTAPCTGKRIFGMDVLDTTVSPDIGSIDVCAQAGGPNTALTRTVYGVNVTDGVLNLQSVYGSIDDPELAAIEVVPATGSPPAPTVTAKTPADASTGVGTSVQPTATFSRGMTASTITSSSFTLAGPSGAVPATVAYNATTNVATLTPSGALANSTTYTAKVAASVKASDGTPLAGDVTWTFTTAAVPPPGTTVRINTGGPAYTATDGRTFLADQYVSGGTTLSVTGTITGTTEPALYQNERWGSFSYAIPVASGNYDVTFHFVELYYTGSCIGKRVFSMDIGDTGTSPDIANLDICAAAGAANKALVRTVSGVSVTDGTLNIQSVYGSADDPEVAAIEVVPSGAPLGPPTVVSKAPADGATGVASAATVRATFSRGMTASTLTASSFTLTPAGGSPVAATVAYDGTTTSATLTPTGALTASTTYTAKLDTTVKAADGTALASPVTWSFTTAAAGGGTGSTVRVNSGGPAYTATDGRVFSADQYSVGGSTFSSPAAITGTTDPALYQNERWGSFSYAIPVTNGSYDVTLHFVELYYTAGSCVGKRVFSIDLGDTAASPDVANLDVCASAGGANKAYVKTLTAVQVSDGTLNIQSVYGSADDPELAAIEVTPSGTPPPPPPDPAVVGQWSSPVSWPLVTVHAALLPTGNVLAWDGFAAAPDSQRVWNPLTGAFTPVPYAVNIFCAGQVLLADGRVLVTGGHQQADVGIPDTSIYNPATGSWTAAPNMAVARWYPTTTLLGDGRALTFSGDNIVQNRPGQLPPFEDGSVNSLPEVFNPLSNSWTSLSASTLTSPLYPYMFVLSDGRVLDAGPDMTTRILNPATWAWSSIGTSSFDGMSAVLYRPNKIMKAGTWADPDFFGSKQYSAQANTAVLDMNSPTPAWRSTASMSNPRSYGNLTLLPDGTVLASGGMTGSDGIDLTKAVLPTEIWNPDTETWTQVASLHIGREYHSTALLLPDGRVLMAGGGQLPGTVAVNQTNAEIFSPPYLFKGTRPTITNAPSLVQYGSNITVTTPDAASITKVSLVRLPSVTHGFDQDQRFQFLSFTAASGSLTVQTPANGNLAPPGNYMLFVVNGNGVPSVASIVRFPAPWEDSVAPTAPTLSGSGGLGFVNLAWSGATDNIGITNYSVYRSTTSGFTPAPGNKIANTNSITSYTDRSVTGGTTYYYVVKAEDAAGNVSPPSNQIAATPTVDTTPPTVSVITPTGGSTVTGTVSVEASAGDNVDVAGVQFKLDGANLGAEDTSPAPYSVSWDTTTATNGSHTLTAVARDAASNTTTSSPVAVTVSNTAPPPPPPGLVASYNFNAGTGTTLADSSGNANTGTITGATWSTAGKNGGALSFNGTSNYVQVADSASLDLTTGMTLEAWVRPSALGTAWRTVLFKTQTGGFVYTLYANQDTTRPVGQVNIGGEINAIGSAALGLNAWSHLAATFDGSALRVYVNGSLVATTVITGSIPISTGVLRIGGNSVWGEWYAGLMDDVRIYNRALTQAQIQTDMTTPG